MGRIDYMMVFYTASIYPDTAKRVERGMADYERCLLRQLETFTELFYVSFGITAEVVCSLNSAGDQLVRTFRAGCNVDNIFS